MITNHKSLVRSPLERLHGKRHTKFHKIQPRRAYLLPHTARSRIPPSTSHRSCLQERFVPTTWVGRFYQLPELYNKTKITQIHKNNPKSEDDPIKFLSIFQFKTPITFTDLYRPKSPRKTVRNRTRRTAKHRLQGGERERRWRGWKQ